MRIDVIRHHKPTRGDEKTACRSPAQKRFDMSILPGIVQDEEDAFVGEKALEMSRGSKNGGSFECGIEDLNKITHEREDIGFLAEGQPVDAIAETASDDVNISQELCKYCFANATLP